MNDRERDTEHEDKPDEGEEYPSGTYLYIRTHPADDGSEPIPQGLPTWQSPDIIMITPSGVRGTEAVADQQNTIEVTVTNAGGMPAVDAHVQAFVHTPGTMLSPANAQLVGDGYVTVQPLSAAPVLFPWTPPAAYAGHQCLVARVSLVVPPDTYTNPAAFDVRNDRHVAQRNIHVVTVDSAQEALTFAFMLASPIGEIEREFELRVTEHTAERGGQELLQSMNCAVGARLAEGELGAIDLRIDEDERERPTLLEQAPPKTGLLRDRFKLGDTRRARAALTSETSRRALVTLARNPDARPNEVSAISIEQYDPESEELIGGLTIIIQYR